MLFLTVSSFGGLPRLCIAPVASLFSDYSKNSKLWKYKDMP
jgi:hypothetical protein